MLVPWPTCRIWRGKPHGVQRHTVVVGNCSGNTLRCGCWDYAVGKEQRTGHGKQFSARVAAILRGEEGTQAQTYRSRRQSCCGAGRGLACRSKYQPG